MRYIAFFFIPLFLLSCNEDRLSPTPVSDLISVSVPETMKVGGEPDSISVELLLDADPEKQLIVFEIGEGATFQNGESKIEVRAFDAKATALLESSKKGLFRLNIYLKADSNVGSQHTINFVERQANEVFSLDVQPSGSIPADGESTYQIQLTIKDDIDIDSKQVAFSTDLGTFSNGDDNIMLSPGPDSTVTAQLKHDLAQTATVEVSFDGVSDRLSLEFIEVSATDIFSFQADTTRLVADGAQQLPIRIKLNRSPKDGEKVSIATSLGSLSIPGETKTEVEASLNAQGEAVAFLSVEETGTAYLTATLGNLSQELTVEATTAYPDFITLNLDGVSSLEIDANTQYTLKTILYRNRGKASEGLDIQYSSNDPKVVFRNTLPSASTDGTSVTSSASFFYAEADTVRKEIILEATAPVSGTETTSDTLRLYIKPN